MNRRESATLARSKAACRSPEHKTPPLAGLPRVWSQNFPDQQRFFTCLHRHKPPALLELGAEEGKAPSLPLVHAENSRVLALQQAEGVVCCSPAVQRHHNHQVRGPIPAAQTPLLRQHLQAEPQECEPQRQEALLSPVTPQ